MTATVRAGIVGCGRLAERGYLPAFQHVAGVRLVAVADPDPGRRTRLAGAASSVLGHPVAPYDGSDDLLAREELDVVLIASPVTSHVADARAAAAAGVAALVEKPPAPDLAGALELDGLTPRPWLGFNRRFDPGARAVRDAMPADGQVELLLRLSYRRPSWGAHIVRDEALLDLGPHLLDWARWLTRSGIVEVACPEARTDRAALQLTLGRGRARLEAATDRPHEELIELRDGAGRLIARSRAGGLLAGLTSRVLRRGADRLVTSLQGELAAVAGAVAGTATDLGTPADGVAVMAAIDAARASAAARGRRVPLSIEEHR